MQISYVDNIYVEMLITSSKRNKRQRRQLNPRFAITEAKLRRIVRDELARQVLVQEGFLDAIKEPFKKLGDKAKKWVVEKSNELVAKIKEAIGSLKVPDDMKEFLESVEGQEGGVSVEELVKMVPGLEEGKATLDKIKEIDFKELVESSKNESYTLASARMDCVLAEERHMQRLERKMVGLLKEAVTLAALGAWYAFSKTVITTLSLIIFVTESVEKITKLLGLKKVSEVFKKIAHFLEKIEDWFVAKAIFPAPVQYAAYLALTGVKKIAGKAGGEKVLSFKEFQSPENKETREKVLKGLKIVLLCVIIVEALIHFAHALQNFVKEVVESEIIKSAKEMMHAGEHAGLEGRGAVKTAVGLGKSAKDIRTGAIGLAGATAAASQV